jgi:NAD(P)-dependent dehydrogenase (short-subunit alcohol dehydrogenase family)
VTVPEDAQRLIQGALDYFGQLDIVVNNAGIERKAPF